MHSKYVQKHIVGHIEALPIEWRDYYGQWHQAFWELMYHKHSSYKLLLDLNHQQAARIMELEHDLRQARRNHE